MVLHEYFCEECTLVFEQITSNFDLEQGKCPRCSVKSNRKLISNFAVGGRGDLRESTLHGCHDCYHGFHDEKGKKD